MIVRVAQNRYLMTTGWTGTPGAKAPTLNWIRTLRLVLVPSGQMNTCNDVKANVNQKSKMISTDSRKNKKDSFQSNKEFILVKDEIIL